LNQNNYIPNIPETDKKRVVIVGVKNRLSIFMNWSWNYFTYDQSLRLLIRPKQAVSKKQNTLNCFPENDSIDFKKTA